MTKHRILLGTFFAFQIFAASALTQAQEKNKSPKPTENPASTQKLTVASPVEFSAGDIWTQDIFSRDDHKVIVLQDRRYNKAKGFEFGIHGGVTKANAFFNSLTYGAHLDYYLSEYMGIEAFYSNNSNSATADQTQLNTYFEYRDYPLAREFFQPREYAGVAFVWAPIYGKFAFFRTNIVHFDLYGTLGAGYLKMDSNRDTTGGSDQGLATTLAGLGLRVFLAQNFSLRFDLRHSAYRLRFAGNDAILADDGSELASGIPSVTLWRQNWQFTLGTSFIFGAQE
jgi:outer membrane beta-barrel protein